jgi:hypothetical protein
VPAPAIRPELARRILWEAEAVRDKFPERFRLTLDSAGRSAWEGSVPVEGRNFPVVVTYPTAYPGVPPTLETTLPLPPNCPHVLARGADRSKLCWIAPNVGSPRRRWDPQRHTAATVMRAAQRWGLALLVWQATGTWPVPDAFEV